MKINYAIYLSIFTGLLLTFSFSCKKDSNNIPTQKENPDFDPLIAMESKVNINVNEIGGTNLFLVSAQDEKSPLTKSEFNTVVSKAGEQFLVVKDATDKIRALTLSTPIQNSANVMNVDAVSTATTLIFLTPGILTLEPTEAITIIQKIQSMNSFSEFKLFMKNNLNGKSLEEIVTDINYDRLLRNCITEYTNTLKTKSAQPFSEGKNSFLFTFSGNSIELQNKGFRFINVVQRDIGIADTELTTAIVAKEMHGATPFSWGALFTGTILSPTIDNINFNPTNNTRFSEFWIVGPGNFLKSYNVPDNVRNVEWPWSETIVYYLVFPLLDLWSGTRSLTSMASPMFKEIMSSIKGAKSTILLTKASDIVAFNRALIDFCIAAVGVIATSAAISGVAGIGAYVGAFLAISSGIIIAPANLGYFTTNILLVDSYSKFTIRQESENVTDVDGNTYKTVFIGSQTWIAENLRTTKYNDNTAIPLVTDNSAWGNLTSPGCCWYNNDAATNKNTYGALYNWYTVNTGKICPTGWHVATSAEWTTMLNFVELSGNSLMEPGSSHWRCPDSQDNSYSGFSAVPGGGRDKSGLFNDLGYVSYFWSSTEDGKVGNYRCIYDTDCAVFNKNYDQKSGLSVRCLQD